MVYPKQNQTKAICNLNNEPLRFYSLSSVATVNWVAGADLVVWKPLVRSHLLAVLMRRLSQVKGRPFITLSGWRIVDIYKSYTRYPTVTRIYVRWKL